jgi:glycerophosphoryl diester phosphodiesterase
MLGFCLIFTIASAAESQQPLIVPHRGLLRHAPENTLANFRACLELRLGFEFDVRLTKDGHPVCLHDSTVDRTTNGTGNVSDLTLKDVRKLDAGSWFDPKFAGEMVPTIAEIFQLIVEYRQHYILVAVDLKVPNVEKEIVVLAEKHKVLHRLLFIGSTITEPSVRQDLRKASAKAHVAVVANNAEEFPKAVSDSGADWVYVRFLPSKEQIEEARRVKKRVFIAGATVAGNLPKNWLHAATVGADAILTDYPLEMRSVFRKEGK